MRPTAMELLSDPFLTGNKSQTNLRLSNLSSEASTTPVSSISSLTDHSVGSLDSIESDQERDLSQFLRTSGVLSMNDILSDSTDGIPFDDSINDAE